MAAERHIPSISERSLSGDLVLGQPSDSRVRLEAHDIGDGVREFSVEGHSVMEREAISLVMSGAFSPYRATDEWQSVHNGLRDLTYPSRRVQRLARVAGLADHLQLVRPATYELAQVLQRNQNYESQTVNIPVFNYPSAHKYTAELITAESSERRLLAMIKSLDIDADLARRLSQALSASVVQLDEMIAELENITGISDEERSAMQNKVILDLLEPRTVTELIERIKDKYFVGFKATSRFDGMNLTGGNGEIDTYILDEDLPKNLLARKMPHDDLVLDPFRDVRVQIGPLLRDKDKKRDLDRYRVTFGVQAPRYGATPKIVWQRRVDPSAESGFTRAFAFPVGMNEVGRDENTFIRPSSLAGAALAACILAPDNNIRYGDEFHRISHLKRHRSGKSWFTTFDDYKSNAGLWPLLAGFKQDELLGSPYFEEIEQRLQ